jgi:hypothetical protein
LPCLPAPDGERIQLPGAVSRGAGANRRGVQRIRPFSDAGGAATFSFCPECGATVFYKTEAQPELIAVPVGAFADPEFPAPKVSVWEERRHRWLGLPEEIEHVN